MTVMETPVTPSTDTSSVLTITPLALTKVRELMAAKGVEATHALRVFVAGGGCSGLQYGMAFESNFDTYDTIIEMDGVRFVVDGTSMMYVEGSTIDFVDSLMGGGFRIDNPNAVSSCGCGSSFRTKENGEASAGGCSTCSSH
ncbi:MAG: iron-sulfur cluster assembly accessory protein [Anaerolineae bacterium]|nr:iron-sulfur cluster assembly accessory protein [Anaerolineae bacterium]